VVLFHGVLSTVVDQYGGGVPYWGSSPSANFENPPDSQTDGDMHYWQVWHALAPIEMYTQQFPRFMSEYGFQSFPEMRTIRAFAKPEDMDIRSATMQDHQKNHGGNERILSYMLRWYPEPKDFASFVYLSQVLQAEAIKVGAEHLRRQMPNTMGSLYWQLNDCWPVASWASIDYYGRWKALQYYAKRFYDDVIVSPFAHNGKVDVYVVSDKLQPLSGTIHTRLLDFSGKVLMEKTQDVQVPAQSSAAYFTLDEKDLLANADPKKSFLVFELTVGGQAVSRNLIFFDTMHNLDLPKPVKIDASVDSTNGSYAVTLRSPLFARSVFLSFGDLDVQISDNYFDLLPGEAVTVKLKAPSSSIDQLKSSLQVESLTDAFPTSETMH
jgi:beta-mannosidase